MDIAFKGYDAAPLKRVFVEKATSKPILNELTLIASKDDFEIAFATDYLKWAQDDKTIIERNKKPHLIGNLRVDEGFMNDLERNYAITSSWAQTFVTGGNSFIGKFPNGEKWMLIGEDEIRKTKTKADISLEYGIEEKNIFTIPQQYYHLDMFLRPVGYPYVLVDNPALVQKKLNSLPAGKNVYDQIVLKDGFRTYERNRILKGYEPYKETIKALKKAGFIPIEVAGVYGCGINFLNAIVNKKPDGTITYITNSSSCESTLISKLEKDFEQELRKKIPNIADIYFIKGNDNSNSSLSNYMMDNLLRKGGGIHCMSLEEPNFSIWG